MIEKCCSMVSNISASVVAITAGAKSKLAPKTTIRYAISKPMKNAIGIRIDDSITIQCPTFGIIPSKPIVIGMIRARTKVSTIPTKVPKITFQLFWVKPTDSLIEKKWSPRNC